MTEPDKIIVEASQWPTVAIQFPTQYTGSEFDAYMAELSRLTKQGMRALIIDTRMGPPPTPVQRAQIRDYVKEHGDELRSMIGVVFITNSALARGALTALSWLVSKPCPIALVENHSAANAWIRARL